MKNKFIIFYLFFFLIFFSFCTEKKSPIPNNERSLQVSLTIQESESRTTHSDNGTKVEVRWAEDDILYVATETNFKKLDFSELKLVSGAGTSTAVFAGTVKTDSYSEALYAFYGAKEKMTAHSAGVQADVTSFPIDSDLSQLAESDYLFGKLQPSADGKYSVVMSHAGVALKMVMRGIPEGAVITGISMDNAKLRSNVVYRVGGEKDNTLMGTNDGALAWQAADGLVATDGETVCYAMMAPNSGISGEMTFTVNTADGKKYTAVKNGLTGATPGTAKLLMLDFTENEGGTAGGEVTNVSRIGKYQIGEALMFYGDQIEFGPAISPNGDCIKAYGDYIYLGWWKGGLKNRNLMLCRFNIKTKKLVTIEFPEKHVGYRGAYYFAEKENSDADISGLKGDSHNSIAIGICAKDGTIHLVYDLHAYAKALLPDRYFNYRCSKKNMLDVPDEEFVLENFNDHQLTMNSRIAASRFEKHTYPLFLETDDGKLVYVFRDGGSGSGNDNMLQYDGTTWSDSFLMFNNGKQTSNADKYSIYGTMRYMEGKFCYGFHVRFLKRDTQYAYYNEGMHYAESVNPFTTANHWTDAFGNSHQFPLQMPDEVEFGPEPVEYYGSYISGSPYYAKTASGAMHIITQVRKSQTDKTTTTLHYYKANGDKEFTIAQTQGIGEMFSFGSSVVMVGLNGGYPYVASCKENTNEWKELIKDTSAGKFSKFTVIKHGNRVYIFCINNASVNSQPVYMLEYEFSF